MMFMFEFHLIFCEQLLLNAKKLGVEPKNPRRPLSNKTNLQLALPPQIGRFSDYLPFGTSPWYPLSQLAGCFEAPAEVGEKGGVQMGGSEIGRLVYEGKVANH